MASSSPPSNPFQFGEGDLKAQANAFVRSRFYSLSIYMYTPTQNTRREWEAEVNVKADE